MTNAIVESLILDLLEWVCHRGKPYDEVMDAWRTSCPKLPIWEEANDLGLLAKEPTHHGCMVRITLLGFLFLRERRPLLMQAPLVGGRLALAKNAKTGHPQIACSPSAPTGS